jgi:RNA polymerase sigma factor (sigma-70 family)
VFRGSPGREQTDLRRSVRDPAAFATFYERESHGLLMFFTRRTLDAQAALDLCAETFAQTFAGRARFRGSSDEEARGYLYAIAHRQLARYLHRGGSERRAVEQLGMQVPIVTADDLAEIEERAGLAQLRETVAAELGRLTPEQRLTVELRVVEELGYDEIAARLDISEPTARARVSRGLRTLAPRLRSFAIEGSGDE